MKSLLGGHTSALCYTDTFPCYWLSSLPSTDTLAKRKENRFYNSLGLVLAYALCLCYSLKNEVRVFLETLQFFLQSDCRKILFLVTIGSNWPNSAFFGANRLTRKKKGLV